MLAHLFLSAIALFSLAFNCCLLCLFDYFHVIDLVLFIVPFCNSLLCLGNKLTYLRVHIVSVARYPLSSRGLGHILYEEWGIENISAPNQSAKGTL